MKITTIAPQAIRTAPKGSSFSFYYHPMSFAAKLYDDLITMNFTIVLVIPTYSRVKSI